MFTAGDVTCVATNGRSTIMLYADGDCAYTADLPVGLYNKLKGRQANQPAPIYVSLGSEDRYYIKFKDGSSAWVGSKAMSIQLKTNERTVKFVAFGATWGTYFIVYEDWSFKCGGDLPTGLVDEIQRRMVTPGYLARLDGVSLGSGGGWYLNLQGVYETKWGGLDRKSTDKIRQRGANIFFMDFGEYTSKKDESDYFIQDRAPPNYDDWYD